MLTDRRPTEKREDAARSGVRRQVGARADALFADAPDYAAQWARVAARSARLWTGDAQAVVGHRARDGHERPRGVHGELPGARRRSRCRRAQAARACLSSVNQMCGY